MKHLFASLFVLILLALAGARSSIAEFPFKLTRVSTWNSDRIVLSGLSDKPIILGETGASTKVRSVYSLLVPENDCRRVWHPSLTAR